jgi:uncharacterized protein YheU (UPF0270 family)
MMDQEPAKAVIVPHTELAAELLRAVIESFVLREGTDYGEKEFSLDQKVARVNRQLERGEAQIVFDPDTETVGIVVVKASVQAAHGSGPTRRIVPRRVP